MSGGLLLSGFEPYADQARNPSAEVARALDGALVAPGWRVRSVVLPVSFTGAAPALLAAVDALRPQAVLALGVAPRRNRVSIERVALNLCDAALPDNDGQQPVDRPVVDGGPPALFATLPVRALQAAVAAAGVPVELSLSAGSYVCNQLMYRLLHALPHDVPAGFAHLPPLDQLALADQVDAVRAMLDAVAAHLRLSRRAATGVDIDAGAGGPRPQSRST